MVKSEDLGKLNKEALPTITVNPLRSGMLDVGDHNLVHWETVGNPKGTPVLYIHGGPGSGTHPGIASWFDPDIFHVVLMDQRGSGLSGPSAGDPATDLSSNTTQHLIGDMDKLRAELEIDQWLILGLSWGTTLALAYAQAHPARIIGLVLGLVTSTSRQEVDWITDGVASIFPEAHARLRSAIPEEYRSSRTVEAYAAMLNSHDATLRFRAAEAWCRWEDAHVSLAPGSKPHPHFRNPAFRYQFARLVTHYWSNDAFLGRSGILDNMQLLEEVPGYLVHGRHDVSSPLTNAEALHKAWPKSALTLIDGEGHGGQGIRQAAITALLTLS
jgi:proline iminopeptidase